MHSGNCEPAVHCAGQSGSMGVPCYGFTLTFAHIEEYISYLLGEESFCTYLLVLMLLISRGHGLPWLDLVIM
jgi:hypothetical protein